MQCYMPCGKRKITIRQPQVHPESSLESVLVCGSGDVSKHATQNHSRASLQSLPKLDRRTRIVHALEVSESSHARKLRDRRPGLFNALEIFDHARSSPMLSFRLPRKAAVDP